MNLQSIRGTFTNGYNNIQPRAGSFVKSLNGIRNNIHVSTKLLQVASSTIDLWNICLSGIATTFVPGLKNVQILTTLNPNWKIVADMTFFWAFLQQPRNLLFPVNATSIDSNDALVKLRDKFKENFPHIGGTNDPHQYVKSAKSEFVVKWILRQHLDSMANSKGSPAYSNAKEFAKALKNRFEVAGKVCIEGNIKITREGAHDCSDCKVVMAPKLGDSNYNQNDIIDLAKPEFLKAIEEMVFIVKRPSLLENIVGLNWLVVDIGTTTMFLKFWNIIDTSRISKVLGNVSVFGKNPFTQPFEVFVRGSICTGLALTLANIGKEWYQLPATGRDEFKVRKLKLDAASAATDLVYHGTCLVKEVGIKAIPQPCIDALSIVVRSIGIYCALKQPAPAYTRILR